MRIRTSLRSAFTLHFMVAAVLPVVAFGYLSLAYLTRTLTEQIGRETQVQARDIRAEVDSFLQTPQMVLTQTGLAIESGTMIRPEAIDSYLDLQVNESDLFESIYLLDPAGRVRHLGLDNARGTPDRDFLLLDFSAQPFFRHLKEKMRPTWSDTYLSPVSGEPSVTLGIPLTDGFLVGSVRLRQLGRIVDRMVVQKEMKVAILDRNGMVIAHSDPLLAEYRANLLNHPEIRLGLAGKEGTFESCESSHPALETVLLFRETGWLIWTSRDLGAALAPAERIRTILLSIALVAVLAGAGAALLTARRLLSPLSALTERMGGVAAGRWESGARLFSTYRELDEVSDVFQSMSETLQERERSLQESRERYRTLFNSSNDGVFVCPLSPEGEFGRFSEVNDTGCRQLGYSREETLALTPAMVTVPELRPQLEEIRRRILVERYVVYETRVLARSGDAVPVEISARIVEVSGATVVLALVRDISERKRAEQAIERLAYFDPVTGLPNRHLFQDRLRQALAQAARDRREAALLFIDLDRFKIINDTLGHAAGDRLLQVVAERISAIVRRNDTFARLGGDEFVIVLTGIHRADDGAIVARQLQEALAPPVVLEGHQTFVTASIGIAVFPSDGEDAGQLLRNADTAMYHSKEEGRNTFRFFSPQMNRRAQERLDIESELRQALERGEFSLHFQPRVQGETLRPVGAEALLRWSNPRLGKVPPDRFIPVAEETGLIVPIGEWVLRAASMQGRQWALEGRAVRVAVNISAVQLRSPGFAGRVQSILAETGFDPGLLELELTESILAEDTPANREIFETLRGMGITFSVDDFGTGYSSLALLRRFPLDILKIDRSLVRELPDASDMRAIVEAILAMGRSLGLRINAEGVETAEQMAFLRERGCDELQGFHIAPPLPAADIAPCLARSFAGGEEARSADEPSPPAVFIREAEELLPRIEAARQGGDLGGVSRLAHELKGTAGMFFAHPLSGSAEELEKAAADGDGRETDAALARVRRELARLQEALRTQDSGQDLRPPSLCRTAS